MTRLDPLPLFPDRGGTAVRTLADGVALMPGFVDAADLMPAVEAIAERSPFRHMVTPGGYRMSVAMTNCGRAGWVTERTGYRYDPMDPLTGRPWPPMPEAWSRLAAAAAAKAGFPVFRPDVCLINRYAPGARLSLHRDEDERDFSQPIVSFSIGLPAVFLLGGEKRTAKPHPIELLDGDALVFGGPARLCFHGVRPLKAGAHPVVGECRINLTFRHAL
ncbi:MAG: DNA oxidative demethylase AlkB [Minwuiales bacterium]|nr:DNA oxidative demethylase AlkB [Minwuiales bacterium]